LCFDFVFRFWGHFRTGPLVVAYWPFGQFGSGRPIFGEPPSVVQFVRADLQNFIFFKISFFSKFHFFQTFIFFKLLFFL